MKRVKSMNALLVEIMIAVLFFALCSVAILEIFVHTKNLSIESEINSSAIAHMQDISERVYASDDMYDILKMEGFSEKNGTWILECDGYIISVMPDEEYAEAGVIRSCVITAAGDDGEIAQLPCVRYVSGEVK